ncbi:hypothetical protein M8756_15950 [Lutimaribacter sp. EGI FJ00015]|uniref:Uncharacterized protein n=1 Tax=Lutimaribacter degradans TaxID=2945989 RepID=A0ACC6A025_9RHOB|nr:hypothetical protein [Lutimaribacter sp. EGI FJ00013]MCM2563652.1 hypothetical protein [Lutimaribacter sp. EGI FJ00013]MCO0614812.1 hypothetical protein [Lutimaribacter sp. EGI FJ00015]MCO0637504.1 hypothetical protein [Lutimaribacter sp. EGI FJ00014]
MKTLLVTSCVALMALAGAAHASDDSAQPGTVLLNDGPLTYEMFETAIDHVDLATCPAEFDPDMLFCRMTLSADSAHVFVFSYDGAQPLHAIKSYTLDEDFLPF